MNLNLKSLIGKLTDTARQSLESAAGLAVSGRHYEVTSEHWLAKLLEHTDGDCARILRHYDIEPARITAELQQALEKFKHGNTRNPQLAPDIEDLVRTAWVLSSINYGRNKVRSGTLLLAALTDRAISRRLRDALPSLAPVGTEDLAAQIESIVAGSGEDREVFADSHSAARSLGDPDDETTPAGSPALAQYTVNLTERARAGELDPVLGRESEIRQMVDILTRRRQNNPILTGEAGVGKTAVVEGFAQRVAEANVPDVLKGVEVHSLDLGLLQAGAGVRGEFENRLKQVIEEVRASARPIVMFIDEAHTMIGAGGQEGQNDAANLLKPALARGELRTIAATTWAEYKKFFEKDAALSRRFQVVKVEEPTEDSAIEIMRGVAEKLAEHHGVNILDDAVRDSVRLSMRYLAARQLPDKSVSVLDTACARVAIGQASEPAGIEDLRRRIGAIDTETRSLERESEVGADHAERLEELASDRSGLADDLSALEQRWETELGLVREIQEIRDAVANEGSTADVDSKREELRGKQAALAELQGEAPLLSVDVDGQTVAEVISAWTGIPIGKMVADEIQAVLDLPTRIRKRVLGQDHALEAIANRIRTARAGLDNPSRPVGVFLLVGPSGVGKTETGLALASELYGGERNMVTINMSEYQEAHTVSSLKGSPPGYVGYGEGGVLTEAVRRRPYSVVLLDEVEKAHPDVMELFFQVFDKGVLEDGEGREIDFKNTVIILTSNVGTDKIMDLCSDPDIVPRPEPLVEAVRPELLQKFPAALLGRMVTVAYYPILPEVLRLIVELQLGKIVDRMRASYGVTLEIEDGLVDAVVERCQEPESGARNVDRILTHNLLPALSIEILNRMKTGEPIRSARAAADPDRGFVVEVQ